MLNSYFDSDWNIFFFKQKTAYEIEGREIAVKVAIDSPDKTDEEANAPEGETTGKEAPAPATEAPTETATATA